MVVARPVSRSAYTNAEPTMRYSPVHSTAKVVSVSSIRVGSASPSRASRRARCSGRGPPRGGRLAIFAGAVTGLEAGAALAGWLAIGFQIRDKRYVSLRNPVEARSAAEPLF